MKKLIAAFVIALAAILAARLSFFTVEEGRAALVLGWNKSVSAEVTEPGLHVKLPDPIERTAMIDCRGQSLQVSALEPKGEGSIPTLGYDVVWRVVKPEVWWKEFKGSGDQTAREITQAVQTEKWSDAHHWLIWHGRKICKARKPLCSECMLTELCPYKEKNFAK